MKKIGKMILGIVVVVGLIIGVVFFFTRDLGKTADQFLSEIKAGKIDTAYTYLSSSFQKTEQSVLLSYLKKHKLDQYHSSIWNSRGITGTRGRVTGTVKTTDGSEIPVTVIFYSEGEKWKISGIQRIKRAKIGTGENYLALPDMATLTALIKEANHTFALSVDQRDMTLFYQNISSIWQSQITVARLNEVFGTFFKSKGKFIIVDQYVPQITEAPVLGKDGILVVKGEYVFPGSAKKIIFRHSYIYEGITWKIAGFSFKVA